MIRTCAGCGRGNRVPPERLADRGRCGACAAPLPPLDEPIAADAATFDAVVRGASVPVLVEFWAAWCPPCRVAAPELAALAREMAGSALVMKVDSESEPELATRHQVRGIPNFVVYAGGRPRHQHAGLVDRRQMRAWLEAAGDAARP